MSKTKILVIAEKPDAGRDMARVLNCTEKKGGYLEGENYIVTWAFGHLIQQKTPDEYLPEYKQWKLEHLPMTFDQEKLLKISEPSSKQFHTIKKLIHRQDVECLINAGDAGREGLLIQQWIYQMAGNQKPVQLLWVSSLTEETLRKGFASLKEYDITYKRIFYEAEARALGDYLLGMNYSRALTLLKGGGRILLRWGRCQTSLLNLVVQNDIAIESFIPKPFFGISCDFQFDHGTYTGYLVDEKNSRIKAEKKALIESLVSTLQGQQAIVDSLEIKVNTQAAPKLHSLTSLQKTMGTKYNYTPSRTLEIAQSLYEKHKILSYPRTSSQYLSTDIYSEVPDLLRCVYFSDFKPFIDKVNQSTLERKKAYFDDSKIEDHHALIPTSNSRIKTIYPALSEEEKNLFDEVVKSFIAIFLPPYIYETTSIMTKVEQLHFHSSGIVVKQSGWKDLISDSDVKDSILPAVQMEDVGMVAHASVTSGKTKSPARITNTSITELMEKYNIGTPATRANIIEQLQKGKDPYLSYDGKYYTATSIGRQFIQLLPDDLKHPELTNRFEEQLKQISDGTISKVAFIHSLNQEIADTIYHLKEDTSASVEREAIGQCPACGKKIFANAKGYGCSGYQDGCNFFIYETMYGKKITETIAASLLKSGKTAKLKFPKKDGSGTYQAYLVVNTDYSISLIFDNKKSSNKGKRTTKPNTLSTMLKNRRS